MRRNHHMPRGALRGYLKRWAALVTLLPLVAACAAVTPTPSPSAEASTVTLHGLSFGVAQITVSVGDVSFVNADSVPHLIAEGQNGTEVGTPRFSKASIAAGQTQAISFATPGDYQITCLIHPTMNMVVHVQS
jgi:plastocyanin